MSASKGGSTLRRVVTEELDQGSIDRLLRTHGTGVLSLTNGADAYAVPQSFGYDGDTLYFQLATDADSRKLAFIEATETASFAVYTTDPSRSVVVDGPLESVSADERAAAATAVAENAEIPTLDVHPERPPSDLDFEFYRLRPTHRSGRAFRSTVERETES